MILHVDVDAFYASVEVLLDPSLAGKPLVVGGTGPRGVVASCTYEAHAFGVRSAMPVGQALRLCPHTIVLPPRFEHYHEFSHRLHEVFGRYTPVIEGIALDEAFLDVTGAERLFGAAEDIGWLIRDAVNAELGLTVSVGAAATKFIAKLASEAAKPVADRRGTRPGRQVVTVPPGGELDFLHPLPVRALWGVGPATLGRLDRFGVRTIGELSQVPLDSLVAALGPSLGRHLHDLSWARDPRRVEPDREVKSVSHEETYAYDLHEHAELAREALRLSDSVASRLRRAGLAGRTVTIKVRFHDFSTVTRSRTFGDPIDTAPVIARTASELLGTVDPTMGVRLFGVGVTNLTTGGARQLTLLGEDAGWDEASDAMDRIRERFGPDALRSASLLPPRDER